MTLHRNSAARAFHPGGRFATFFFRQDWQISSAKLITHRPPRNGRSRVHLEELMQVSHVEEFEQTIENGADRHDGASTSSHNPLPNGDIAVPIKDEADEGVEAVPPMTADFDPIAVADNIAGHL